MTNRIKFLRKEKGLTQTQLAEMCQTSLQMMQYLENGQRQLTQKWMIKIAQALDVSPSNLLEENAEVALQYSDISEIRVMGEVQAGVWSEAIGWEEYEQFTIPITNSKYKNAYALAVKGDSMDLFYKDGSYVIVVPIGEKDLKDQQKVIVQRKRRDGITEATVKQLVVIDGVAELWPRSTNPKHQTPIPIHWPYNDPEKVKTEIVEITGIVIGTYSAEEI